MLWRSQTPADFSTIPNATTVELNFLEILFDALAARGLAYAPVAIVTSLDAEAPALIPGFGCCRDIRVTDRDVVLARGDLGPADLKLSNVQAANFATQLVVPSLGGPFPIPRGWTSVDAKIRGRQLRFVTTHLESADELVRLAQAAELLAGPGNTTLPVVLVGDFNTDANGPLRRTPSSLGPDSWTRGAKPSRMRLEIGLTQPSVDGALADHPVDAARPGSPAGRRRCDHSGSRKGPAATRLAKASGARPRRGPGPPGRRA